MAVGQPQQQQQFVLREWHRLTPSRFRNMAKEVVVDGAGKLQQTDQRVQGCSGRAVLLGS
jgi:hypothetical protein